MSEYEIVLRLRATQNATLELVGADVAWMDTQAETQAPDLPAHTHPLPPLPESSYPPNAIEVPGQAEIERRLNERLVVLLDESLDLLKEACDLFNTALAVFQVDPSWASKVEAWLVRVGRDGDDPGSPPPRPASPPVVVPSASPTTWNSDYIPGAGDAHRVGVGSDTHTRDAMIAPAIAALPLRVLDLNDVGGVRDGANGSKPLLEVGDLVLTSLADPTARVWVVEDLATDTEEISYGLVAWSVHGPPARAGVFRAGAVYTGFHVAHFLSEEEIAALGLKVWEG